MFDPSKSKVTREDLSIKKKPIDKLGRNQSGKSVRATAPTSMAVSRPNQIKTYKKQPPTVSD